ncbi:MAG: acyl-CoA thioesterase [Flavobacterium sp.]|nr:acyl-CoA thioesterase [Flavobacterium sp.]
MQFKKITDSETTITELMLPSYANFGGKVHGGILLSLMDKVAYVTATKHCASYCVTVAVDGVEFLNPVEVGDLLSLKASVNYVGNTTGIAQHTNSCYFTMAAKDDDGNLIAVPGLAIETETQLRRFCEGIELKKLAKQKRVLLKSNLTHISTADLIASCATEKCSIKNW